MNLAQDISTVLVSERTAKGLSKAELSRRTGYSVSSITNMEKGNPNVLWRRYSDYMHALGITWEFVPRDSVG